MKYITIDKDMNVCQTGVQAYQFAETTIYINGLIYSYGRKAGKETVEWLNAIFSETGIVPYEELRGSYSCIIVREDYVIAFSDNSKMHCLYYSSDMLSSSFLKIVQYEIDSDRQLYFDLEAMCEYLTLGNVYFGKTFFSGIRILNSAEIIVVENGKITICKKPIGDIDADSRINSFSEFFDKLTYSLSDMRVCQALTGGYDSRLVYTCLSNRIKDHPAISANDEKNKDVIYARKVAMANHDNLEIIKIEKPIFSDNIVSELFEMNDGILPLDIDTNIRLITFRTKLAKVNNLHITGDGGVLHKDWEWTQDFPFYKKRKSNANQFYRQRLYYLPNENHIGEALRETYKKQAPRFVQYLDSIAKDYNTQSYDFWYYHVSGNRQTFYNCNPVEGIISYAPLNEIDLVRFSYALPRRKRFFFNSMRETITKENREIARIRTNYGTNASNELPYVVVDIYFQAVEYARKAFRLIGRKLTHKNVMSNSVLDWSFEEEIRKSNIVVKAFEYAKQNGFLEDVPMESYSYSEIQRIIHLYCLFCFVSKKEK